MAPPVEAGRCLSLGPVIGGAAQGSLMTTTLFIYHSLEERQYIAAYSSALALGLFSLILVLGSDWLRSRKH